MRRNLHFPTLEKTLQIDQTIILGRHIHCSNLLMGINVAFRDFYGEEEGDLEFKQERIQIEEGRLVANTVFNNQGSKVIYPISRLFPGCKDLNTFARTMAELEAVIELGQSSQVLEKSCARDEGYSESDVITYGPTIDLLTILSLESIRNTSTLSERGLHIYLGGLLEEVLKNRDEILEWNDIFERLKDLPEKFHYFNKSFLH